MPNLNHIGNEFQYTAMDGNLINVTTKDGFTLIRLTAKVKNLSNFNDASYAGISSGKGRKLDAEYIFLVSPSGNLLSGGIPSPGCDALRSGAFSIRKGSAIREICFGTSVDAQRTASIDIVFPIPNDSSNFRLYILGGLPTEVASLDKPVGQKKPVSEEKSKMYYTVNRRNNYNLQHAPTE